MATRKRKAAAKPVAKASPPAAPPVEAPVEAPVVFTVSYAERAPFKAVDISPAVRLKRGDVAKVDEATALGVSRAFEMGALPPNLRQYITVTGLE